MVNLYEIVDQRSLWDLVRRGYVKMQSSQDGNLAIFNYTNKTQFDGEWNEITEQTRGLIVEQMTANVLSRPFRKFHNWSQIPAEEQFRLMGQRVDVYEKWDGSLGVLYPLHTGEFRIATRGSFDSPQALHATRVLQERYPEFEPILGLTYLFEIVYPENRIVVDYGGLDDLILLAVIDIETGRTMPFGRYDWTGPINQPVGYTSLTEVLAAPQESNREGFVVHFPASDLRVKFKFDAYKALHGLLTETSSLTVWNALATGSGIEAFIDHVPDEFYDWVHQQVHRLESEYAKADNAAREEFNWIMKRVKVPEWDRDHRKEFALLAQQSEYKDVLFGLYDDKDISSRLWKRVKPEHEKPFSAARAEDNA